MTDSPSCYAQIPWEHMVTAHSAGDEAAVYVVVGAAVVVVVVVDVVRLVGLGVTEQPLNVPLQWLLPCLKIRKMMHIFPMSKLISLYLNSYFSAVKLSKITYNIYILCV